MRIHVDKATGKDVSLVHLRRGREIVATHNGKMLVVYESDIPDGPHWEEFYRVARKLSKRYDENERNRPKRKRV
jgi:hypothetical protein